MDKSSFRFNASPYGSGEYIAEVDGLNVHTASWLHVHCSGGVKAKTLTWLGGLCRAPSPGHLLFLSPLLLISQNNTT